VTSADPVAEARKEAVVFGHFDDAHRDYVITTPLTPRPWENRIWNDRMVVQATHHGSAIVYVRDGKGGFVLFNWTGQRALYVLDRDSGCLWSPSWFPVNTELDRYEARQGLGVSTIRGEKDGVAVTWTTTVDPERCAELWQVRAESTDGRAHRLLLVPYYELDLTCRDPYFGSRNLFRGEADPAAGVLHVANVSPLCDAARHAVGFWWGAGFDRWEMAGEQFLKRYSSAMRPATVVDDAFGNSAPDRGRPVFAVRSEVVLEPGRPFVFDAAVFAAATLADARQQAAAWRASPPVAGALQAHAAAASASAARVALALPGLPDLERFASVWLRHQLHYNADWNRGWGIGFRDSMQDCDAWRVEDPAFAARRVREAAAHIYRDGHTVRKWAPRDDKLYFDGGVWFANTLVGVVGETGDTGLLDAVVPYEDGGEASVLDHAFRALDFLNAQRGPHGLCRMGFGDWNDALNGVDRAGRGESVWTSMAYVWACRRLAGLLKACGRDGAEDLEARAAAMADTLNREAFDGDRYLRAFTDDGAPVGARSCDEGRCYLNPQAWAVIAGVADGDRTRLVLETVERELMTPYGPQLLAPPYRRYREDLGRISSDAPGTVENGGVYVHAAMFHAYALAVVGRADDALAALRRVLPDNPDNPSERSGLEPYQLTNQYEGLASAHPGRAMFAWRTGSVAWWHKTFWEGLLGIRTELDALVVQPCLPAAFARGVVAIRPVRGKSVRLAFAAADGTLPPADLCMDAPAAIPYAALRDGMTLGIRPRWNDAGERKPVAR
jgi:cellobiose phosphorylase